MLCAQVEMGKVLFTQPHLSIREAEKHRLVVSPRQMGKIKSLGNQPELPVIPLNSPILQKLADASSRGHFLISKAFLLFFERSLNLMLEFIFQCEFIWSTIINQVHQVQLTKMSCLL